MRRKPGETLQGLAASIRQDAATCEFASIKEPQDEALRSRFVCSVNNEAVLGQTLTRISKPHVDTAYLAVNIRTDLPILQSTHGCFQRDLGVDYTSIMQSTSWVQAGCCSLTHIPNTHASILRSPFQQKLQLTYWSRVSHFLVIHTP